MKMKYSLLQNFNLPVYLSLYLWTQVPLQATLLFLATTTTPTTGGLETLFTKDSMFGVPVDPKIALGLSVAKSIFSCVNLHLNTIVVQKVFVPFTSKVMIWTWGLFATLRRILSIVTYFIPFFGLFDILNHWKAEHIPFWIRYSSSFPETKCSYKEIIIMFISIGVLPAKPTSVQRPKLSYEV